MIIKQHTASYSDIKELIHVNAIEGEVQIAYFRLYIIVAALLIVLAISINNRVLSHSEYADLSSVSTALIYNICLIWLLKRKRYYKKYVGFISSTIDIALISIVIYFARYGTNSSVVTIMTSSAFVLYVPVILFSLRRHDPFNSLYTGCLAGMTYFGTILAIAQEGAFGILFTSNTGLIVMFDMVNEYAKPVFLMVAGVLGYITAKNYDSVLYKGIETETENERIRHLLDVYTAPELVEKFLNNEIPMEGEKREITVMFVDIKNFTSLSEAIESKLLVQVLSDFFSISEKIISNYKGFIDKFIGDSIMVLFGAPLLVTNHREQAVMCAIELRNVVENLSGSLENLGINWNIEVGIGINTGEVIIGNVGSENRKNYTAIGDAVNVAARIERLTRQLNKQMLIGESVYIEKFNDLTEDPIFVNIKGKSKEIRVYPLKL